MFKTHEVALHPGMGHSRGMFPCLHMTTADFSATTNGHVLLIFFRTILVVHVPILQPQNPQGSASPRIMGSTTTSPLAHPCQSNGHPRKQMEFCSFCGLHSGMWHTGTRLCTQLGTFWHLSGFYKGR